MLGHPNNTVEHALRSLFMDFSFPTRDWFRFSTHFRIYKTLLLLSSVVVSKLERHIKSGSISVAARCQQLYIHVCFLLYGESKCWHHSWTHTSRYANLQCTFISFGDGREPLWRSVLCIMHCLPGTLGALHGSLWHPLLADVLSLVRRLPGFYVFW